MRVWSLRTGHPGCTDRICNAAWAAMEENH